MKPSNPRRTSRPTLCPARHPCSQGPSLVRWSPLAVAHLVPVLHMVLLCLVQVLFQLPVPSLARPGLGVWPLSRTSLPWDCLRNQSHTSLLLTLN